MPERLDATLSKGMLVLEALSSSPHPLGISDLAARLALNKSNVHRLVRTLKALEYLEQEPDRTYRCTLKVWKLGNAVMGHMNLPALAAPAMHALAQLSGETVHLSVIDGINALYVEKVDSARSVRAYSERGGSAPLHCVATGKVLLAFNYELLRPRLSGNLSRQTARTITTLKALDKEMETVRVRGLATNLAEYRDDVTGVAAPVRDPAGRVIAAVGVSGPLARFTRQQIRKIGPAVREAGQRISEAVDAGRPL
ncbi:IclR family transcriptional regulator [Xanthobacter sp. KR7-225]|uniref:IclR family transcriptional regulator n=1 Tax=Xanthobacter sp. KR7-225 TaxID=3156613 RepID=UPI0032B5ECE1